MMGRCILTPDSTLYIDWVIGKLIDAGVKEWFILGSFHIVYSGSIRGRCCDWKSNSYAGLHTVNEGR